MVPVEIETWVGPGSTHRSKIHMVRRWMSMPRGVVKDKAGQSSSLGLNLVETLAFTGCRGRGRKLDSAFVLQETVTLTRKCFRFGCRRKLELRKPLEIMQHEKQVVK